MRTELGIGANGFPYELRRFLLADGEADGADPRCSIGRVEAEMPDLERINSCKCARRMAGDDGLGPAALR
jgi:hypothetical protein